MPLIPPPSLMNPAVGSHDLWNNSSLSLISYQVFILVLPCLLHTFNIVNSAISLPIRFILSSEPNMLLSPCQTRYTARLTSLVTNCQVNIFTLNFGLWNKKEETHPQDEIGTISKLHHFS